MFTDLVQQDDLHEPGESGYAGVPTSLPSAAQNHHSAGPSLLRSWGPLVAGVLFVSFLLRMFVVQTYFIPSGSMIPTLEVGDRVVVNRLSYESGSIERGQVIVFSPPPLVESNDDLIKRVIGLPGDTVRFVDNEVYIDGLRMVEPYLLSQSSTRPGGSIPGCDQPNPSASQCVVPDGFVFVLGDNRRGSSDSRDFGPVDMNTIVGRAFVRVWPATSVEQL